MADVRLTATNPEDSSVVPVACDASGRLLLQELPEFDGTVDGDLTVTGKSSFAGGKSIIGNDGSAQFAQGALDIYANGTVEFTQDVTVDGSATFGGAANISSTGVEVRPTGLIKVARSGADDALWAGYQVGAARQTSEIFADGSTTFAGGKAGFTAEGYLWCTTRRGDTVILDATSNGLASWVEYTPTTRIDAIRDELNSIRGDAAEMPTDTP